MIHHPGPEARRRPVANSLKPTAQNIPVVVSSKRRLDISHQEKLDLQRSQSTVEHHKRLAATSSSQGQSQGRNEDTPTMKATVIVDIPRPVGKIPLGMIHHPGPEARRRPVANSLKPTAQNVPVVVSSKRLLDISHQEKLDLQRSQATVEEPTAVPTLAKRVSTIIPTDPKSLAFVRMVSLVNAVSITVDTAINMRIKTLKVPITAASLRVVRGRNVQPEEEPLAFVKTVRSASAA
jgi:hypothetical protein